MNGSKLIMFVDTETTGLNPRAHQVTEIAFRAWNTETRAWHHDRIWSYHLQHTLVNADDAALRVQRYYERDVPSMTKEPLATEDQIIELFTGVTLAGFNPRFDAAFLAARWGVEPWHYRLLDMGAFLAPFAKRVKPFGLQEAASHWRPLIRTPIPDHTAKGDVNATCALFHWAQMKLSENGGTR